jgi:hypothetical protein
MLFFNIGYNIKKYIPILNTVTGFDIEAPKNEKWLISGICEPPDIEESSKSNAFSSIFDCFDIEDSSISAFKTFTDINCLCFNINVASILILASPARAGLQQLQAAVYLRWYSVLMQFVYVGTQECSLFTLVLRNGLTCQ